MLTDGHRLFSNIFRKFAKISEDCWGRPDCISCTRNLLKLLVKDGAKHCYLACLVRPRSQKRHSCSPPPLVQIPVNPSQTLFYTISKPFLLIHIRPDCSLFPCQTSVVILLRFAKHQMILKLFGSRSGGDHFRPYEKSLWSLWSNCPFSSEKWFSSPFFRVFRLFYFDNVMLHLREDPEGMFCSS